MPNKAGPWQLNELKSRLRREQEERERVASDRYRQAEKMDKDSEKSNLFNCILCLLVVLCLLLSLIVLFLATLVLKDRNIQI